MKAKYFKTFPAALRASAIYEDRVITRKELIDNLLLVRKLTNIHHNTKPTPTVIIITDDSTGERWRFNSKAEKDYINKLLSQLNKGSKVELEHSQTISQIKKPGVKTTAAAKMIAADHLEEDSDYYTKLGAAKLEHGGSVKMSVDELLEETKQYLDTKKNLFYTIGANSKTDFGQSRYINVFKEGSDSFENRKIRISDHSVTNINRLMDEYHIFNENDIKNKVDLIEYYFFPEKFTKQEVFKDNIVSMEIPATQKRETDIVVSERLSSAKRGAGRLIYSIKRNNPQKIIEIINPNRNNAVIGSYRTHLEHGGNVQSLEKGTVLQGPSHENGGIDIVVNNKPVAEAEGGEVVINAENSKKYCQELSEINQRHGNGKPLNCDEDDRSEFMRQGGSLDVSTIELDEEDLMARGGSINKRMKFPKNYKPQEGKYGSVKKDPEMSDYQKNKEIEKIIDQKGIDPNAYTFEEKQFLRQYSGYGGIDVEEFGSIEEAKKALTEFYTPDAIIRKMWALAYKFGFKDGQSVLEPSVGTGEFLKYVPVQSMATGYEINKYSYSICKILYPQFDFYLQPFENVFIKNRDTIKNKLSDVKKFDLVIGNPPYGDVSGLGMGMGEKQYTNAKNWTEYFILRGLDLTLPNGLLIYIIGTEVANGGTPFLQQGNSKIKQMIADRAELLDAYRLPNGVFDRTDVLSDILVFKRK